MGQLIRTSLKRHATTNWLFALMGTAMVAVVYAVLAMTDAVALMRRLGQVSATPDMVPAFLVVLTVILLLFTIVFLLYMNALLLARRTTEIGTYRMLGMPASRLALGLVIESLALGAVTVVLGLIAGVGLSKFFVMMLMRMMQLKLTTGLLWSPRAALELAGLFSLVYGVLGALNAVTVLGTPLRRVLMPSTGGTMPPLTGWRGVLGGVSLTGLLAAYVGAFNLIPWTYAVARIPNAAPVLWLGLIALGVLCTYGLFRLTLPGLAGAVARSPWVRRQAVWLLTLTDLRKRLRHNSHSLFLTTMLATLTMTVLGSGAMLYQFSQGLVQQTIALDGVVSASGRKAFAQGAKAEWVTQTVTLPTKLVAGTLQGAGHAKDKTLYNVIALSDYQRIRRVQSGLPTVAPTADGAVLILYGQALIRRTWLAPHERWTVKLPRVATQLTITQITSRFPLGGNAYFDRALVVRDATYAAMKAPRDVLTGYRLSTGAAVDRYVTKMDNRALSDHASYQAAALTGQKTLRVTPSPTSGTISRSAISLKAPMLRLMNTTFGLSLFIAVLLGFVFMVATASILLMKQLVAGVQERASRQTLAQLGMPAAAIRRVVLHQTLAVFALPLCFGALNTGLIIHSVSTFLDDPGLGLVAAVVAVYVGVYIGFALLTVRLIQQDDWAAR
ncbi:FtsX-like permease family protein [Lacticaseibacillus daqingensis]|uniref:FtsX-like permease family protein n=1 Tax=Lacticaseibacillus daqingensis TaxID=2486014 RepID=UPI000F79C45C|nr:ABC transporter permease [Lacticaseibacillus daqingensis]